MIITATHAFVGVLDLSALERLQKDADGIEGEFFRISIRPGQSMSVDDKWYGLQNIQSALRAGYIRITNRNSFILGAGVSKITVSTPFPVAPLIGDLWVDIG